MRPRRKVVTPARQKCRAFKSKLSMILLTIQEGKLITVHSKNLWETYKLISLQKKCVAGEMLVIVKAEDRSNRFKYEMHFPAHLTSIIYQNIIECKSNN
jgi:hypothetical protein